MELRTAPQACVGCPTNRQAAPSGGGYNCIFLPLDTPVSYTHLDVYKRQDYGTAKM